ncbi:MAG: hypothetical protein QOF68_2167 [Gaiellales bacterium]|nr:hypothetical protein [Gaiellales bacterium]
MQVSLRPTRSGREYHRLTPRSIALTRTSAPVKGAFVTRLFCCHRVVVHNADAGTRCAHCGSKLAAHTPQTESPTRRHPWHHSQP